jgi:Flp pilus assembly protein TadG
MKKIVKDQRGFVFIFLMLGVMFILCAFAGLALDVGRLYVVKTELQNAADATALVAAAEFYDRKTKPATLTWNRCEVAAKNFIGKNSAEGSVLTDCQIETGYWNMKGPSTQTLQAKSIVPGVCAVSGAPCTTTADCSGGTQPCRLINVPAVKVTVNKTPGENGGPLQAIFAGVVGWKQFEPGASAIAVSGYPGSAPACTAFPFAISECLKNDFIANTGIFSGGADPDIVLTNTVSTSYGTVLAGQWTNLVPNTTTNSSTVVEYINCLINPAGNKVTPSPSIGTGDVINVATGVKDVLYQTTADLIKIKGGIVYVPVVQCNVVAGESMVVQGFAQMQLTASDDPKMTIVGHFLNYPEMIPGASPGGVASNVIVLPAMVR